MKRIKGERPPEKRPVGDFRHVQKSPMRSQSIKARSRSETSLTVLLIKTDRFRLDMTLTPRI
jgi:hypothetical protein